GSVKYVVGGAFGPKSRGGVVTVLGGPAGGFCGRCPDAIRDDMAAAPAAPSASTNRRRVSINIVLNDGDGAAGAAIDGRIAAGAHGVREVLDERQMDVRRRWVRLMALPPAGPHDDVAGVERGGANR